MAKRSSERTEVIGLHGRTGRKVVLHAVKTGPNGTNHVFGDLSSPPTLNAIPIKEKPHRCERIEERSKNGRDARIPLREGRQVLRSWWTTMNRRELAKKKKTVCAYQQKLKINRLATTHQAPRTPHPARFPTAKGICHVPPC